MSNSKLRLDLITPEMEEALAQVLAVGCEKYGERDWETGTVTLERHLESIFRHIHEYRSGVTEDKESGLHPLKHALCRLGMMVTQLERGELPTQKNPDMASGHGCHIGSCYGEFVSPAAKEKAEKALAALRGGGKPGDWIAL